MEENQNRAPQFSPEETKAKIPVFQQSNPPRDTPHASFFNGKRIIVIVLVLLVGIFVGWILMRQSLEQFDSEYDFDETNFGDGFDFDEDINEYSGASQDNSNTPEDSNIPVQEEIPESGDVETNPEGFSLFNQDGSMFTFLYPEELTQPLMEQVVGNSTSSRFHFSVRYLSEEGYGMSGLSVNAYADMFAFDPTQEGPEILVNSQTRYINTKNFYGGQVFSDSWGNEYFVASGKNPCDGGLGVVCSGSWIGVKRLTAPVNGISYILVIGLKEVFTLEEFKQTIESIT